MLSRCKLYFVLGCLFIFVGCVGVYCCSGDFVGYCEWERLNCCAGCRVEHGVVFEGSLLGVVGWCVSVVTGLFGCLFVLCSIFSYVVRDDVVEVFEKEESG